jgi:uncharacterized membrane protein YkoI
MIDRLTIAAAAVTMALLLGSHRAPAFAHEREERAAREDHDQEKALGARERGEILPLNKVMAAANIGLLGEIAKIELEKEGGVWIYEFKIITPKGRMVKVSVDAKTGKLIEKRGD